MIHASLKRNFLTDSSLPIITNDILTESIKVTNTYCLQGIENNNKISSADEDSESDRISGLESVVTVLEEVLIWPAKYPTIFEQSPLRNQAGVLLYGPPGKVIPSMGNLIVRAHIPSSFRYRQDVSGIQIG